MIKNFRITEGESFLTSYSPSLANQNVAGLINRKMACPDCGPKFKESYKKFCDEVERELKKERNRKKKK